MKILLFLFVLNSFLFAKDFDENYSNVFYSSITFKDINEGSTLEKSFNYKDTYWTLNDSGDKARIFAVNKNGDIIKSEWGKKYKGIDILDAHNIDWEWLTFNEKGNLFIGDTGNNYNYRKDLAIYELQEPNPNFAMSTGIIAKYPIKYPDQTAFPPLENDFNFDCEAGFFYNDKLYLISKNRSNYKAKIYVFDSLKPWQENIPKIYKEFDFLSMVTDASISKDKKYLAILTYDYIWLFEKEKDKDFFSSKIYKKKINLGQCEGIAFDENNEIIISNEKRKLFKFNIKEIKD